MDLKGLCTDKGISEPFLLLKIQLINVSKSNKSEFRGKFEMYNNMVA